MSQYASFVEAAPAQSIAVSLSLAAPAQSIAYSAAPVANDDQCQRGNAVENRWTDFSPQEIDLPFPELPEPDYKCYQPPTVPQGQTRYLNVDEPAQTKNLEQNFNDVRTAVRENNTHLQRNRTQITNVNRNHNHLLRIVTNENNYEHNLTNKIVRVADIHRQKIENVKGETRNFKDFKQTQKVEAQGCRRAEFVDNCPAPPPPVSNCPAPAISIAASQPARTIMSQARATTLMPSTPTEVQYLDAVATGPSTTLRSIRNC